MRDGGKISEITFTNVILCFDSCDFIIIVNFLKLTNFLFSIDLGSKFDFVKISEHIFYFPMISLWRDSIVHFI